MMQAVLQVTKLSKHFRLHAQDKQIPSCSNVSLRVDRGQLTALLGPTGAGKSSVLKCIFRTYLPSSGSILYRTAEGEEVDLGTVDEHRMLALREREIGFVTQFMHCVPRKSALDIVAAPLMRTGAPAGEALAQAAVLLERLKVPGRLWSLPPANFSGGEKQRINLARGLITRPRLLLLDEPTASLDERTTDCVVELLQEIKREGVGMLAIFHQSQLVARLADRAVRLAPPTPEKSCEP